MASRYWVSTHPNFSSLTRRPSYVSFLMWFDLLEFGEFNVGQGDIFLGLAGVLVWVL